MALSVALILAKKHSNRLPEKNTLDFNGEPMFLINVKKCLKLFPKVYVSSDSKEILALAKSVGAIPIKRDENLCGDVPNIPVYKHALKKMGDIDGIVAVQANSPTISSKLIFTAKELLEVGYQEIMTCHPLQENKNYHEQSAKIYGSIWALSTKRLENYGDYYKPKPEILLVDTSVDIETEEDLKKALCQ